MSKMNETVSLTVRQSGEIPNAPPKSKLDLTSLDQ